MSRPTGKNHCGSDSCPGDPYDGGPCNCACETRCGPWNEWLAKGERVADAVCAALGQTSKMGFGARAHSLTWDAIDKALRSGEVPGVPAGTTLEDFLKKHGRTGPFVCVVHTPGDNGQCMVCRARVFDS